MAIALVGVVSSLSLCLALRAPHPLAPSRARTRPIRLDEDRCYYGAIDSDGNVLDDDIKADAAPAVVPDPSLSPSEVVDAQFKALSRGGPGLAEAFAFVSPKIIEQYSIDLQRYREILNGYAFEGLIGCSSWTVLNSLSPTDDRAVLSLRVLPRPIPGCVKTSGVADQGGITWPSHYVWTLCRETDEPFSGCWMVEQMAPKRAPPIDVDANESVPPRVAPAAAAQTE